MIFNIWRLHQQCDGRIFPHLDCLCRSKKKKNIIKKKQKGIRLDQGKGPFKTEKPLIWSFTSSLSSSKYLTWKWLMPKEALICKKCWEISHCRINLTFSQKRPNFSLTTREPSKAPTAGANPGRGPLARRPCTSPRTTPLIARVPLPCACSGAGVRRPRLGLLFT